MLFSDPVVLHPEMLGDAGPRPIGNFRGFWFLLKYFLQHCLIYGPSDSHVLDDAGIDLVAVATFAWTDKRFDYLDLIWYYSVNIRFLIDK